MEHQEAIKMILEAKKFFYLTNEIFLIVLLPEGPQSRLYWFLGDSLLQVALRECEKREKSFHGKETSAVRGKSAIELLLISELQI